MPAIKRRKSTRIRKAKWAVYAAAGAAAVAALPNDVDADIHYSGPLNLPVNGAPGSFGSTAFNIGTAVFGGTHYRLVPPYSGSGIAWFFGGASVLARGWLQEFLQMVDMGLSRMPLILQLALLFLPNPSAFRLVLPRWLLGQDTAMINS